MVGHKNGWCVMDTMTYGGKNYPGSNRGGRRPSPQERCERHGIWGLDRPRLGPDPQRGLMGFGCVNMGISSGCSDEYEAGVDCQWIDITDTPDGYYWLTVATNWDEAGRDVTSPENDYTNNEANVAIRINGTNVTKLSTDQVHQECPEGAKSTSAGARAAYGDQYNDEPEMMTGSRIRAESFPESGRSRA